MVKIRSHPMDRVARAGLQFVNVVRANEQPHASPIESFESNLWPDEQEAWRDLCEAVDVVRKHIGQ